MDNGGMRDHARLVRKQLGSALAMAALSLAVAMPMAGCAQSSLVSEAGDSNGDSKATESWALTKTVEVDGRQGIAAENGWYWVSGSTTLSKYDRNWNLVASSRLTTSATLMCTTTRCTAG